ncbi:Variant-specific surface protein, partial [Giardia duodenalis]
VAHLSNDVDLHPSLGGCYDTRAAPGGGACREARGGACVGYAEEARAERTGTGEARNPRTVCTAEPSGSGGSCNTCEATIGQTNYCSKCNEPDTYAPVDGVCEDVETQADKKALCTVHTDGACTECGSTSFLYKGGCYQPGDGKPGQSLCLVAKGGVCTEAATGYFVPTGVTNAEQSVVACDDTTGVTVTASSTYKGVAGCQECAAPDVAPGARADKVATCTRCQEQKYLKDNECVDGAAACGSGYAAKEDTDNGNKCVSCKDQTEGVTDCETCEYNMAASKIKCTKCGANKYLKTAADGTTTCVTECGEGYFKHTATDSNLKTCQSCSGTNNNLDLAAAGVAGCAVCTYDNTKVTCTKCKAGKYLKTAGDSTTCVEASGCRSVFFPKADDKVGNRCVPCGEAGSGGIADCAECSLFPHK